MVEAPVSVPRRRLLEAARTCLLDGGYANLSTRRIADEAGLALGHLHYYFRSKRQLLLAVLAEENDRLLERQRRMYADDVPLWKRWEQACDFLDDDLESGYVRVLQELTAAGWSDPELAAAVRSLLQAWYDLLTDVAGQVEARLGGFGPLDAAEIAALVGDAFLGAETMVLLGVSERQVPHRSALRKVGEWIRQLEEPDGFGGDHARSRS
jgi:AcrR family transcriptional regulator